jgi:hypothetical protein
MQKVLVSLEDDLDGSPADETVKFGLDGHEYVIDLRSRHAKEFRRTVRPYVEAARKKAAVRGQAGRPAALRRYTAEVRAWAKREGYKLGEKGRIPGDIVEAYERVHGT